jgi:hypothetical protein
MKIAGLLFAATVLATVTALCQGQFVFNNRIPPDINARVDVGNNGFCFPPSGDDWEVQLLGRPAGAPPNAIQPLTPPATTFRPGAAAGYVVPVTVTVPGARSGEEVVVTLRIVKKSGPESGLLGRG